MPSLKYPDSNLKIAIRHDSIPEALAYKQFRKSYKKTIAGNPPTSLDYHWFFEMIGQWTHHFVLHDDRAGQQHLLQKSKIEFRCLE